LPHPTRPRVDVGVVTWNSAALTAEAVGRLLGTDQRADLRLLVWDNASTDGTAQAVRSVAPDATIIESDENIGFARAVNRLIHLSDAPWFLALNSDAWPEPGAVGAMVETATNHPRAAVVAPKLLRPDGSLEHSTHPFPSLKLAIIDALGLRFLLPQHTAEALCLEGAWQHDRLRRVDWAVGAALLMNRAALERVGPFDERFFLYNEDLEWCVKARACGFEVWFDPGAVVRHVGNFSGTRRFGERRAALDASNLRVLLDELLGRRRATMYRALQTVAVTRRYLWTLLSGAHAEQAHWRLQLRAALGLVPPPILSEPDDRPTGPQT
jgi:N-acetylglucosaminyl-diphospho-decaprenol L-rhamnosyltransferase